MQPRIEFRPRKFLQFVGEVVQALGHDGIQHDVHIRAGLAGTHRPELELVSGEGERTGTVAVRGVPRQHRKRVHAHHHLARPRVLLGLAGNQRVNDIGELFAQEDGENGWWCLVGAKPVIVASGSRGTAQQVGMKVDRPEHGGQHGQEHRILLRRVPWIEQILAPVGDRPVVVLAGAVDAGIGLLVKQADQPMAFGDLAQDLHREHVVVDGEVQFLEDGCQLKLRGRDLVVARLRRNAQPPQFVLNLIHERQDAWLDCAEVVVFQLLMFCRSRSEERTAGLYQIRTLIIELLVHQEILLFRPHRDPSMHRRHAKARHQTRHRFVQCLHRP